MVHHRKSPQFLPQAKLKDGEKKVLPGMTEYKIRVKKYFPVLTSVTPSPHPEGMNLESKK